MKWLAGVTSLLLLTGLGFAQAPAGQSSAQVPPSAAPQHARTAGNAAPPITLEQTREMFDLMGFNHMMQQMLHTSLEQQRERAPYIPQDVWEDFESSFAKVDFVQAFLPAYQKYLSREDAARAIEFYKTPAGQHTLSVMPALMQDLSDVSQQKGEEVAQQVLERHRQEIEDAEKKAGAGEAPPSSSAPPPISAGQPH